MYFEEPALAVDRLTLTPKLLVDGFLSAIRKGLHYSKLAYPDC